MSGPLPEGSRGGLLPDICFRRVQYSTLCLGATPLSSLHHHHWGANLSADAGTRSRRSTGTPVGDVPLGTPHRDVPQGLQREPLTGSGDVLCRKPRGPVGCRAPDLPPERWFWGSAPGPACLRAVGQRHSHTNCWGGHKFGKGLEPGKCDIGFQRGPEMFPQTDLRPPPSYVL